jgi:uncharacterized BrkB/YihY/UPF0761 family membrane protein
LLKGAVNGFIEDEALTRGAAIAFYTATSFAPVLLIVIAIAGLVYGREAAQGAITTQLGDLMGGQTAELLQTAVSSSKSKSSGFLAAAIGIITLIVTASGVFGEMQAALNKVWKAEAKGTTVGRLVQARAKSLGLVIGFPVDGLACRKRGFDGLRSTDQRCTAVWRNCFIRIEPLSLPGADLIPLCGRLQSPARLRP